MPATGEQNLSEVVHALLTTMGSGCPPDRPQQMGLMQKSVNRFVLKTDAFFPEIFLDFTRV